MTFDVMPQQSDMTIATSCNSTFMRNKAHLTNFKTPRASAHIKDGLSLSLGGVAMSSISSVRTPRTHITSIASGSHLVSPRNMKNSFMQPDIHGIKIVRPPHQEGADAHLSAIQENGDNILKQVIYDRANRLNDR